MIVWCGRLGCSMRASRLRHNYLSHGYLFPPPPRVSGEAGQRRGRQQQGRRFGHRSRVGGSGSGALAVVSQHDREVVDVHRAIAGELALGPCHAGLAIVASTMVRSLMSTWPSRLASPGNAGVRRNASLVVPPGFCTPPQNVGSVVNARRALSDHVLRADGVTRVDSRLPDRFVGVVQIVRRRFPRSR